MTTSQIFIESECEIPDNNPQDDHLIYFLQRNREDREEESMVRMAEAILEHDYPSETHNSEERVQVFENELEEKLKKLRAKGQLQKHRHESST